ncbi:MAG TPA: AarF/ABC1/UbiB kinase family protein [Fimbriimonadaceae bacterium]|nr:AarF/ABC1/UbiB kinase family protein [Fimbriimonadaceae bacterium]
MLGTVEKRSGAGPSPTLTQPERLRLALEELGPTFIKLGQMLSTRPDLLPPDYIVELSKLQDHAPTVPYDEIASIVRREFGEEPGAVFPSFEVQPRAAASIAQVHSAKLPDGAPVVVKVRRPHIEAQVEQDLTILGQVARFLAQNAEFGKRLDLESLADEFSTTLRNELDFTREGQNAERIAAQFTDDPSLLVPTIYWEYSTHCVLTMQEIQGIKIDDLEALSAAGIDRQELAKRCAHIALVQVLDHGFFHADPHPGNFFVQPDGVIGLLDYGMVGQLSDRLRASLLRFAMAISRHDSERLVDELLALGAAPVSLDRRRLKRDLENLLTRYDRRALGEISAAQVFRDVTTIAQNHGLKLPSDLILLARVVALDEGLGAKLDPDFKLIEFAQPYFKRFWQKNHSLRAVARRAGEGAIDLADLAIDLPERLVRLSGMIERGEVTVTSRLEVPEELTKKVQRAANRIAVSVLTAGLIIGLSVMALVYRPAGSEGFGYFLLKTLLGVGVASGVWLAIALWKSTR